MKAPALLIALSALAGAACSGSTVLEASTRAVAREEPQVEWRAAEPADLPGLYVSDSIDGAAAAVLLEVRYYFDSDGSYSGAALLAVPEPEYRVLTGDWLLSKGTLSLSDAGEPADASVSGDLLRLTGSEGTVVLRKHSLP